MPLTFDLAFEQLRTYQGKNPCPDDFDSFWDRSLMEMRAVDPQVELTRILRMNHRRVSMIRLSNL